ncbi:flagellar biosynthesis protein FlhB [Oceanibaculum pacificum]|uniref:Flagellar biosynthetic protein FlhB n=1 Tax=Oceanibaculum pacificum TaxID=580166 RepID=A0A154VC20_9PROT|nr:flagellar biosynthesis protein FlhB [Oceanibaculum pacificum]KZC98847.1 flagellar biosynthetic protein FlhB [Oceanibaculum pacificum]
MSDEDDSSKTEDPTSKKLEDAREKGQVPVSREISSWFSLLGGLIVIGVFGAAICKQMYEVLRPFLEKPHEMKADSGGVGDALGYIAFGTGFALIIPVLIFVAFAFMSNFMQNGLLFAPEAIAPKLQNISPLKGLKQIFSLKGFVEFLKGLFKIAVIGALLTLLLWPELSRLEEIMQLDPVTMLEEIRWMLIKLLGGAVAVMAVIAIADLVYQRYQFTEDMRMTKQEVRDEYKQTEGDPHVKGRLRNLRMQRARQRMMAAVPSATVVITNPTHYAVALKYERDSMEAPMLVAKGVDAVALRIRELAEESGVPIVENPPVARLLFATVELDQEIKAEQYQAVAEIITYVFRMDRDRGGGGGRTVAQGANRAAG